MRNGSISLMVALLLVACGQGQPVYDVVLQGGRVIDPESGLDGIRNVGILADSIAVVSSGSLTGNRTVDVTGLVVAPGFIDLHRHRHNEEGYRLAALDGVTMALELEVGVPDVQDFVAAREGRTLIHFGASASHGASRVRAWGLEPAPSLSGPAASSPPSVSGPVTDEPASEDRLQQILNRLAEELDQGALGIGMGLEYTPGATRWEVVEVFRLAARHDAAVFVHARSAGLQEPGSSIESIMELIGASAVTGAGVHIMHINSICLRQSLECLSLIADARQRGLDVTTEAYPYTFAGTSLTSAVFAPGWQERRGLGYGDLEVPGTGERLTQERFEALRGSSSAVPILIHMNREELVADLIAHPLVMIGSDGGPAHPRGAGTFARILSRYVRADGRLDLPEAVRKMSYLPATRLQGMTNLARRVGRVQAGALADLVVFDAATVEDRASIADPQLPSVGVQYLLVAGMVVIERGTIVEGVSPGRAITSQVSSR